MKCASCGNDRVAEGSRFCGNCGAAISARDQTAAYVEATVQTGDMTGGQVTGLMVDQVHGNLQYTANVIIQTSDSHLVLEDLVRQAVEKLRLNKQAIVDPQLRPEPAEADRLFRDLSVVQREVAARGVGMTPQTLYNLGMLASGASDFDAALDYFRQANHVDPDYPDAYEGIALVLQTQAMHDIYRQDYVSAEARLTQAREASKRSDPLDLDALALRGYIAKSLAQIAGGRGNQDSARQLYTEAARYFEHVVRLDPNNALGHNGLGNVQYALGDLDASIQAYSRAIELNPSYTAAYNDLALAFEAKAEADPPQARKWRGEALRAWEEALQRAPGDALFTPAYIRAIAGRIRALSEAQD